MIFLLDNNDDLGECGEALGFPAEQLLTPLTRYKRTVPTGKFAIDNGAFTGFQERAFLSLLERERHAKHLCRFLAVPDVPFSARRTLEVFKQWHRTLSGWPLALVAQDGQEDLEIPWLRIAAIFIGGTDSFKMSQSAKEIIRAAQALGKWVHVGRVNGPDRFGHFEALDVDSVDGSGIARYDWMRERIKTRMTHPNLFAEVGDAMPKVPLPV